MNKLKITGYQKKNNNIVTEGEGLEGAKCIIMYGTAGGRGFGVYLG